MTNYQPPPGITPADANGTYVSATAALSAVTRDGSSRVIGFTDGSLVYSSITRDGSTGLVTSYVLNGVTHTVTRDGSNRVTGVS